jgi:hypothetical protein
MTGHVLNVIGSQRKHPCIMTLPAARTTSLKTPVAHAVPAVDVLHVSGQDAESGLSAKRRGQ